MKKTFTIMCIILFTSTLYANGGIFDSFAIVNSNSSGNSYYDLGANTANTDFAGADLGHYDLTNNSIVLGGQLKSYKNSGTDVTGAALFYRIYPDGSPSGSFTQINYEFQIDNVGGTSGDQQWGTDVNGSNTTDKGVEILAGQILSAGTYVLEVYAVIFTNGVDANSIIYDSNNGLNYIATFTLDEALPVELTTFNASILKNKVMLEWETATEVNNFGFEVQKRKVENNNESVEWKKIGFVEGSGNSNSSKSYSFSDNSITSGIYKYRLKQIDIDGKFEYSDIIEVDFEVPTEFSLSQNYPNPFNPSTLIEFSLPEAGAVKLDVFNSIGEKVTELINKNMDVGHHNVNFNAENLKSGIYFYRIQFNDIAMFKKMILLK